MAILWILLLAIIAIVLLFLFLERRNADYFESKGILYLGNGTFNMLKGAIQGKTIIDGINAQYDLMKSKNAKIAGGKDFGMVTVMIADMELLKHIFVKDFEHFTDRRQLSTNNDKLLSKMLSTMTGDKWRSLRSKMSPTFTTGKIRRMFSIFDQSGKKLVKYVQQEMANSGQMDLTEGYSKYTMDVIASAAFGIDSKAFDQVESSMFEQMGKKLQFQFGPVALIKFFVLVLFPKFAEIFGMTFIREEVRHFFSNAIKSTLKQREESGEKRDDFIQLMLEARAGQLKTDEGELEDFEKEAQIKVKDEDNNKVVLDDDCITANCVLFILGGFDTTQSLLLFAAYALALHTEVQDKLREEISKVLEENDGEFTYDAITKMEYMDQFINETLRFYPPAVATDRGCNLDYKIPNTNFIIKKGEAVGIHIMGIHHDEQYYTDPEKFNPERFSPENRSKLNPLAFLPFGHGPRNCIGMRFALTEVKLAIAHLVHNFNIQPSEKTLIPMKFSSSGSLKPEGGMWLALNYRN